MCDRDPLRGAQGLSHVASAYADHGKLENATLYDIVADRTGLSKDQLNAVSPVGKRGAPHRLAHRSIRWHAQTLKHMGVIKRVEGERGVWEFVAPTREGLHVPAVPIKLVAFSTDLGVAIWGDNRDVFSDFNEPIHLLLTSPPFPLIKPRAYGNPPIGEYVDFIIDSITPLVRHLARGASIVLNLSNDCFVKGLPARSTYIERLTIALEDRLGLFLMDRLPWVNTSKAPAPVQWASIRRFHRNAGYEPLIWFSNDPLQCFADNRRVLEPHTEQHLKLIAQGGEQRHASFSDGAYRIHPGRFGNQTDGRIPRNVLTGGHRCADAIAYRANARALGLKPHGAVMPTWLTDELIQWLTEPDQLVVDNWGGKGTTALSAERLGRRWVIVDRVLDYLRVGGESFRNFHGYDMPDAVSAWPREHAA